MKRFRDIGLYTLAGRGAALALLAGLLSACRVERTPPEYLDKGAVIETEREAAAREVQDRLLALTQALNRGGGSEVLTALDPEDDAYVVGPAADSVVRGPSGIRGILGQVVGSGGQMEMHDLEVRIGPQANVAWFRGSLHSTAGGAGETPPLRITGVYLRDAGLWKLVQAHLSRPVTPAPPPLPSSPEPSAADSAEAE